MIKGQDTIELSIGYSERDPKELAERYLAFYNIVYPDMGPDHAFELTRELLRAEQTLLEFKL